MQWSVSRSVNNVGHVTILFDKVLSSSAHSRFLAHCPGILKYLIAPNNQHDLRADGEHQNLELDGTAPRVAGMEVTSGPLDKLVALPRQPRRRGFLLFLCFLLLLIRAT